MEPDGGESDQQEGEVPRGKRVTIVDVARHAGVSTAAASKALRNAYGVSDAMARRVQASIEELGYRPLKSARGMRGRTFTIGVMLSDLDNPFFGVLIDGLIDVLRPRGFDLLVAPAGTSVSSHKSVTETLADYQMDGLVLISPLFGDSELEKIGAQTPTVVVGRHGPGENYDTVSGDDAHGAALIVDHLVGLGHQRIAFITQEGSTNARLPQTVRSRGFLVAMRAHGLESQALLVPGEWSYDGGRSAAAEIAEMENRPTAIHAGADVSALGVLDELLGRGIAVPGELSVAGYDNSPTARLLPIGLTSVDQSGEEMGRETARLLAERIEGRRQSQHLLMTPTLRARTTTSKPREDDASVR